MEQLKWWVATFDTQKPTKTYNTFINDLLIQGQRLNFEVPFFTMINIVLLFCTVKNLTALPCNMLKLSVQLLMLISLSTLREFINDHELIKLQLDIKDNQQGSLIGRLFFCLTFFSNQASCTVHKINPLPHTFLFNIIFIPWKIEQYFEILCLHS